MPQLVGQSCSMCGERIGSELESGFCKTCGNPVHNRCRKPSAPTWTICTECGTDKEAATKRAQEREKKRQEELARLSPPPPLEIETAARAYQLARWFISAVAAVMLGIAAIAIQEPGSTFAGVGAIAVGVVIAVIGVALARR